jgi:hypothetical protein
MEYLDDDFALTFRHKYALTIELKQIRILSKDRGEDHKLHTESRSRICKENRSCKQYHQGILYPACMEEFPLTKIGVPPTKIGPACQIVPVTMVEYIKTLRYYNKQ